MRRRPGPATRAVHSRREPFVSRGRVTHEHADLDLARLGVHGDPLDQLGDDRPLLVAVDGVHRPAHRREPGVHGRESGRTRPLTALVHLRQLQPAHERGALALDGCQLRGQLVLGVEPFPKRRLHAAPLQCQAFQLDARRRLGISEFDPDVARVQRGAGSVTVVGLAGAHAMDLLYRSGPGRFGRFDGIVVDTPPVRKGGCLPGVLLVAPTDGDDASANLIRMLRATPANTEIVLVRIDRVPESEWAHDAGVIAEASNHSDGLLYLPGPLPRTDEIRNALNCGRSVWTLARRGATREFLQGVESLAGVAWSRIRPDTTLPPLAPNGAAQVHIRGWDDDA